MHSVLPARSSGRLACGSYARPTCVPPTLRRSARSCRSTRCSATQVPEQLEAEVTKAAVLTSALGTLLAAGNVSAAQEIVDIAAQSDPRYNFLATVSLPFLAWVGFNIFGPAIYQIAQLQKKPEVARSMLGFGLGLAMLFATQHAFAAEPLEAAGEAVNAVAAALPLPADVPRDNRFLIILSVLIPVVGWVGFNILGPAQNQLSNMSSKNKRMRSTAGAVGLGAASLLVADQADAASEVAQLAAGDNRLAIIAVVLIPVVGWVGFNILGPALAQLSNMQEKLKRQRGIAGAVGLGAASLLAAEQADASTEVAQLAAGDNRLAIIAVVLIPVVGWVGFNILGPALAQLSNMQEKLKRQR